MRTQKPKPKVKIKFEVIGTNLSLSIIEKTEPRSTEKNESDGILSKRIGKRK